MKPMTNLEVSQDKVQLAMARKEMNPYDLCSKAEITLPMLGNGSNSVCSVISMITVPVFVFLFINGRRYNSIKRQSMPIYTL